MEQPTLSPLRSALDRQTPSFDALISVIQDSTDRINRNRELAKQVNMQKDLARFQADLNFESQLKSAEVINPILNQQKLKLEKDSYNQSIDLQLDNVEDLSQINENNANNLAITNSIITEGQIADTINNEIGLGLVSDIDAENEARAYRKMTGPTVDRQRELLGLRSEPELGGDPELGGVSKDSVITANQQANIIAGTERDFYAEYGDMFTKLALPRPNFQVSSDGSMVYGGYYKTVENDKGEMVTVFDKQLESKFRENFDKAVPFFQKLQDFKNQANADYSVEVDGFQRVGKNDVNKMLEVFDIEGIVQTGKISEDAQKLMKAITDGRITPHIITKDEEEVLKTFSSFSGVMKTVVSQIQGSGTGQVTYQNIVDAVKAGNIPELKAMESSERNTFKAKIQKQLLMYRSMWYNYAPNGGGKLAKPSDMLFNQSFDRNVDRPHELFMLSGQELQRIKQAQDNAKPTKSQQDDTINQF